MSGVADPARPRFRAARRALVTVVFAALAGATVWALSGRAGWQGDHRDVPGLARWVLAATSEPQFYAVGSAGTLLLAGGLVGHLAHRRGWYLQGFVQACGTGIWPWVAGAALLSVVLGALAWGTTLTGGAWQPLFAPLVSVAPAVVALYGPGLRVFLTGAVSGALLVPPAAIGLVTWVCTPLGLPPVVGATGGMALAGTAAFLVCPRLRWMPAPWTWRSVTPAVPAARRRPAGQGPVWVLRRALADLSEAQFFGNEWASAALVIGALLTYATSPESLSYGSGRFVTILSGQLLTVVTGVVVWRRRWRTAGFYPTFVPAVSLVPAAVLTYHGALVPTVVAALAGALVAPPTAAAISGRLPAGFHPFVGNVAAMSICTALIVPSLTVLPGVQK
ncbi:hypothetical protein GTW43_34680 [Streptomyces sp. SID5785]|uniref:hypothetical protein n=1 Tax=Streptomyces sp. SID5785 TaxID=2690309 RepID=UPI0013614BB4|nr:hypothetical protein [Streptomyces sp. SID5785]MZD10188.1 hypothetical protein [Streptomyces sp. SID5785]